MKIHYNGDSPSGKATDSDSVIRVFESLIPSQAKHHPIEGWCFACVVVKSEKTRINGCSRDEQTYSYLQFNGENTVFFDLLGGIIGVHIAWSRKLIFRIAEG